MPGFAKLRVSSFPGICQLLKHFFFFFSFQFGCETTVIHFLAFLSYSNIFSVVHFFFPFSSDVERTVVTSKSEEKEEVIEKTIASGDTTTTEKKTTKTSIKLSTRTSAVSAFLFF